MQFMSEHQKYCQTSTYFKIPASASMYQKNVKYCKAFQCLNEALDFAAEKRFKERLILL